MLTINMYPLATPWPTMATRRMPASRQQCVIGKTRKARKAYCMALFNNDFSYNRPRVSPIYLKQLARESRHMVNSYSWY